MQKFNEVIGIILIIVSVMVIILTFIAPVQADEGRIYRTNGTLIDEPNEVSVYKVQFKNKIDALAMANTLPNGDVFQDKDSKLYQVIYGNVKITGVVVVSSINEN